MDNPAENQVSEHYQQRLSSSLNGYTGFIPQLPPRVSIQPPRIPSRFTQQPFLERISEAIRYSILNLEYSLSPSGALRQWLKLNGLLFLWFGVPTFLLVPVVTSLMNQCVSISAYFQATVQNLMHALVPLFILVGILSILIAFIKK